MKVASELPTFLSDPRDGGFFLIFILVLPIVFIHAITLPFFILFPHGTIFLLRLIKTEFSPQDTPSQSRGLLAVRIVSSLQKFRYWLTSEVGEFVGNKMEDVLKGEYDNVSDFYGTFLFGWFILLPSLFLFVTLFVILFIPFFALFFLLSFIFTRHGVFNPARRISWLIPSTLRAHKVTGGLVWSSSLFVWPLASAFVTSILAQNWKRSFFWF